MCTGVIVYVGVHIYGGMCNGVCMYWWATPSQVVPVFLTP